MKGDKGKGTGGKGKGAGDKGKGSGIEDTTGDKGHLRPDDKTTK